jgi:hypothetical protein
MVGFHWVKLWLPRIFAFRDIAFDSPDPRESLSKRLNNVFESSTERNTRQVEAENADETAVKGTW